MRHCCMGIGTCIIMVRAVTAHDEVECFTAIFQFPDNDILLYTCSLLLNVPCVLWVSSDEQTIVAPLLYVIYV